jgi:hypothetical protein
MHFLLWRIIILEVTTMITFTVLTIAVLLVAAVLGIVGTGFLAIFGDLIVCGMIIGLIVKLFRRKK